MRNLLLLNFFLFVFDEWRGVDADGWSSDRFTDTQWRWTDPDLVLFPDRQTHTVITDQQLMIIFKFVIPLNMMISSSCPLSTSETFYSLEQVNQKTEDILEFIFGIFLLILVCYGITKHNYYFPNNISIFKSHLIVIFFLKLNMTHILFLSNLTRLPLQNTSGWMTMKKLSIQKRFVELKAQYCTF